MRPVSSATEMNSTGDTTPRVAWFQRISASKQVTRIDFRLTMGWK